jgi:hypothetical protein
MYTTNPARLRLHRSLTLTILAEDYKWLNSFRVLLDFCYFLFLELFGKVQLNNPFAIATNILPKLLPNELQLF